MVSIIHQQAGIRGMNTRLRKSLSRQEGCVIWFTGLPGSGKTTVALALEKHLLKQICLAMTLDGDALRQSLCRDLGFSKADRNENVRRAAEIAKLLADAGIICMMALISPFRKAREQAKMTIGAKRFFEIYVSTDLAVCEHRDTKGFYRKARKGEVREFTGVSSPYEPPKAPDITLDMARLKVRQAVLQITQLLKKRGIICSHHKPYPMRH